MNDLPLTQFQISQVPVPVLVGIIFVVSTDSTPVCLSTVVEIRSTLVTTSLAEFGIVRNCVLS